MERRVLVQGTMRPRLIIVGGICAQDPAQVRLTEYDHVVQALPADRANEPLNVSVLPGPLGAPPSSQPAGPACFGSRVIAVRLARRFVEIPDFIGAPGEIRTPDPQIRRLLRVLVSKKLFCKTSQFVGV